MKLLRIIFHIDSFIATIIVFLVIEHFTIYQNLDFLNPFINIAQDLNITDVVFSKIRNDGRYKTDTNIVLINIGNLSRKGIAKQVEIVNRYKPAIVSLDIRFTTRKSDDQDIPLRNVFNNTKNLILPIKLNYDYDKEEFNSITTCHPFFTENAKTGFVNVIVDRSYRGVSQEELTDLESKYAKTIRQISIRENVNGTTEYDFAARILQIYAPEKFNRLMRHKNNIEIIDFRRNIDKYITLDVSDVFEQSEKLNLVKDKIVMFGFIGPDIKTKVSEDIFFTPLNPQFVGKSFPDMYGVVVHANVLSMMLDESYFYSFPDWMNIIIKILILYFMMTGLLLLRYKFDMLYEPLSISLVFGSLFGWFVFIVYLFNKWNLFIDLSDLFFYILLTVPVFELYQDSFKPMTLNALKKATVHIKKKLKGEK
jgi:CHASE2 domain-containing sensor protein